VVRREFRVAAYGDRESGRTSIPIARPWMRTAVGCSNFSCLQKCRRNGLLVSTEGSAVLLLPSLAIDRRTASRGLDVLARSI
jgi:hypothetical protein